MLEEIIVTIVLGFTGFGVAYIFGFIVVPLVILFAINHFDI